MTRIQKRVTKLTVLVSMLGVFTLGAAPALADNHISYYAGHASGQALNLKVSPNAVLNADLSYLNTVLSQIPLLQSELQQLGLKDTLKNVTSDILVTLDSAQAGDVKTPFVSSDGTNLSSGTATTTPVTINDDALKVELDLLKQALTNIPKATTQALLDAIQPLLNNLSAQLAAVDLAGIETAIQNLSNAISDTLSNPAVNVFDSVTSTLPPGGDLNNGNVTVGPAGLLTTGPFVLGPFEAKAMAPEGTAFNNLTNLSLVPNGSVGILNIPADIQALLGAVQKFESDLSSALQTTLAGLGLQAVGGILGQVDKITGTLTGQIGAALNPVNAAYNNVVSALSAVVGLNLNGLLLNDIVTTPEGKDSTALGTVHRSGDVVNANSIGNLLQVDVLKLTNPLLVGILDAVAKAAGVTNSTVLGKSLLSVNGIKGVASVTLDGVNPAKQSASGQLLDIQVLGKSLSSLVPGLSLDNILPAGTTCTIKIPGGVTCPGLGLLGSIIPSIPQLDGLITITLTRGAGVYDPNASVTEGSASIVTLGTTVDLDCSKIAALVNVVNGVTQNLPVKLSLCGGNTSTPSRMVALDLGVANAALSLTPNNPVVTSTQPQQTPPNTGSSVWILGLLAAFLVMAGAGIGIFRARNGIA